MGLRVSDRRDESLGFEAVWGLFRARCQVEALWFPLHYVMIQGLEGGLWQPGSHKEFIHSRRASQSPGIRVEGSQPP